MRLWRYINYLIPPLFYVIYKKIRGPYKEKKIQNSVVDNCLTGPFSSWEEAIKSSTGYDDDIILQKTKNALLKVKSGEAVYERDSVIFDDFQYSWPLLAGLMWAATQSEGQLNVLDFGGSLGSTYFQNKKFLDKLPEVQWNVVEQPKHVEMGKCFFQDNILKFYYTVEEYLKENTPNAVVLGGILQYLENPHFVFSQILEFSLNCIILDRTPIWNEDKDILCVQHVSPKIYSARYPSWIFSKKNFINSIQKNDYEIVVMFKNDDKLPGPVEFDYYGMILSRKKDSVMKKS